MENEFKTEKVITDLSSLKPDNPIRKYDYLRITDSTEIPKPIPLITINDEIISTEGNITTISGSSKSGKSAFTSILMAGAISKDGKIDGLETVKVQPNPTQKAVMHFDTEQSGYDHQSNLKSIIRRSGIDTFPDFFRSYNIRKLEMKELKNVTWHLCKATAEVFGGIHLIVIDGGADYLMDVNDPVHSNALVKYFEDLAMEYNTAVIIIIHTNPGSDKERGHLGSQFQRKSESVIIVRVEDDISYIEPKFLRNAGKGNIPKVKFKYDKEKGYHVGCGIKEQQHSEGFERIENVCKKIFSNHESLKYGNAIDEIMKETDLGSGTAKGMFTTMKNQSMIVQDENKNWRLNCEND